LGLQDFPLWTRLISRFRTHVAWVTGGGKKLFAEGSVPHSYKLTRSRVSSTGVIIAHYEHAGDIKIGGTALDSPSDRERARRERMKREG